MLAKMLRTFEIDEKRGKESVNLASEVSTRENAPRKRTTSFPMSTSDTILNVVTIPPRSLFFRNMCVTHFYVECARKTHSPIKIDIHEHFGMPVIVGVKGNVPLRDFVDALDESIDITELRKEFPELNAAQISGAMDFLRQLSEFNVEGFDLSGEEDRLIETNTEFQDSVRQSISSDPVNVRTSA